MMCPNPACLEQIANTFPGLSCPQCGTYLFPTRPFDKREYVWSRPKEEQPPFKKS